jgi:hypothetical protein
MAAINTGTVRTRLTQNRRFMSASSGFCSSSAETVLGSRAIPQIGQLPGWFRTTSGCIGQVYSAALVAAGSGASSEGGRCSTAYRAGSLRNFSRQCWLQKK